MADNIDELTKQLNLINKINAVMNAVASSAKGVAGAYASQSDYAKKTVAMMQQLQGINLEDNFNRLNSTLGDLVDKMKDVKSDPFKAVAGASGDAGDEFEVMAKKLSGATGSVGVFATAVFGLKKGFQNFIAIGRSTMSVLWGIADFAVSVSAAIISIPFKILGGLINFAAKASLGMAELRRELEEVRKQFGAFSGPASSAVIHTTKTLKGFSDTGLRAWRIFGTLAERLRFFREQATALGATFSVLTNEFRENGGAIAAYQKGLGVGNEEMKSLSQRSITMGKSLSKTLNDIAKQSLGLGRAFNLDQKLISRDMSLAAKDVKHFGAVTVKEIGVAAVYARKLGVELDKIVGTLDAFETFDSAAENAAKLSQSFGVQLDAFKLMEAQSPADQIDMLRKSFKAANVDASQFNRQQLHLLQSTIGLDEATTKQIFSSKNYGVSLEDVKKKGEVAEKSQLSQAEAMSKLADSIERLIKDGPALRGSFFQQFIDGFLRGIQVTGPFRQLIYNIRQSLRETMRIGVQFGRAFVESFGGVKEALTGLKDLFKPENFRAIGEKALVAFKSLLSGKISFDEFMNNVSGAFKVFLNTEAGPFKHVVEGFKKFFIKLADYVGPAIAWAGEKIAYLMNTIADYLSGKKKLGSVDASGASSFLARVLLPIFEGFEKAWVEIKPAAVRLIGILGDKLVEVLKSPEAKALGMKIAPYIVGIIAAPAVIGSLAALATELLFKGLWGGVKGAFSLLGKGTTTIATVAGRSLGALARAAMSSVTTVFTKVFAPLYTIIGGAINVSDALDENKKKLEAKFGETNAILGAGAAGIYDTLDTLLLGLLPNSWKSGVAETIASWGSWFDDKFKNTMFESMNSSLKVGSAKTIELIGFLGTGIKNAWEQTFNNNDFESKIVSPEELKKRNQGFFSSLFSGDMFSEYGRKLSEKVHGTHDEILKKHDAERARLKKKLTPPNAPENKQEIKLPEIDARLGDVTSVGDMTANVSKQLAKAQGYITKIANQAPKLAAQLGEGGVKTSLNAIRDMVKLVQDLDDALAKAPKIDVSTKLGNIASGAGLGSKAQYTVKSKEVVIQLNLQVVVEADKLEKVIVLRKESIIRDRLEFATIKNPGQQGNNSLPEQYTEKVPPLVRR